MHYPAHERLRLNLEGLYHGLNDVVNDVLGVDGQYGARVWYWVEEEDCESSGKPIVERRVLAHRQEIQSALLIHERILNRFESAEKYNREEKPDGVRMDLRELVVAYESYLEAVEPIGKLNPNELRNEENNFWRFPMYNCGTARTYDDALASVIYIKHLLSEATNEGLEKVKFEFNFLYPTSLRNPAETTGELGDMSTRGRLLFVKKDLKENFSLDVDSKEPQRQLL